ncbi:putative deoxynucleoside kinase [Leptopilina boulardi filamentous virus]|uniref:Putative deoxynucleoside kinase n=1 Tax=Leptopilina boulardi filamentous virus TaxID=552509 RepID=A0A1S5YD02_9VIRU|nr:putative deoxynucleoside kinase [Leptopilina boulardi filamentous virus]AQQ79969.1 putative deoxynucleoside kinase [Leptopilina boulardi filamentous virus]
MEKEYMSEIQYVMFEKSFDFLKKSFMSNVQQNVIYLQISDAHICMNRIKNRQRLSESLITLEYIQQLNKNYDNWLLNENNGNVNIYI